MSSTPSSTCPPSPHWCLLARVELALEDISPCANEIAADYLINLELPDEGATCTL